MRSEGLELVSNLREMSNSLRGNAERLFGDVQRVHSSLVAQIARVERATSAGSSSAGRHARTGAGESVSDSGRTPPPIGDDGLDVPEFIPPG